MKRDIIQMLNGTTGKECSPTLLDEGYTGKMQQLADDDSNVIRAFTVTLEPGLHKVNPREVRRSFINLTKLFVCNSRKPLAIETHFEFTQAMVIHMHGLAIGRPTTVGRLFALYRGTYGYSKVKTPHDLNGWLDYCSKSDVYPRHIALKPPKKG